MYDVRGTMYDVFLRDFSIDRLKNIDTSYTVHLTPYIVRLLVQKPDVPLSGSFREFAELLQLREKHSSC